MPLYEYQCEDCGHRTEVIQRLSDPPLETCEECGGPVRKLFSAPAVQFKGTGWYVTDYGSRGRKEGGKKAAEAKGEGKAADAGKDRPQKTGTATAD